MDKLEAAAAIRKLAKQYEPMVVAAELLEKSGSFDQAVKEAKASLEDIQKKRAAADGALKALEAKREQGVRDAQDVVDRAKQLADEVGRDAQETAATEISEAQEKAKLIVEKARADGNALVATAQREANTANATAVIARQDAKAVQASIVTARDDLARIISETNRAKEKLREFMQA
jgi:vacuolar-type H+-ATPase subunit D/Vma8